MSELVWMAKGLAKGLVLAVVTAVSFFFEWGRVVAWAFLPRRRWSLAADSGASPLLVLLVGAGVAVRGVLAWLAFAAPVFWLTFVGADLAYVGVGSPHAATRAMVFAVGVTVVFSALRAGRQIYAVLARDAR